MPSIRPWTLIRQFSLAALGTVALVGVNSATANAVYGPPPPPVPVPGGYFQIVTSQTIGTAGGTIGPVSAGNVEATLTIPGEAFTLPLQVTITEPTVADIGNGGRRGHLAIGGVGVVIQDGPSLYPGIFSRPLILTLSSPQLSPGDVVVVWNGTRFMPTPGAIVHNHSVTIRILSSSAEFFAILKPAGSPATGLAGPPRRHSASSSVTSEFMVSDAVFERLFRRSADFPMPGLGVLAPAWLNAFAGLGGSVTS
jgi:hypothetical protein